MLTVLVSCFGCGPSRHLQKSPDPLGPKSQKSQKRSFSGSAEMSQKMPEKVNPYLTRKLAKRGPIIRPARQNIPPPPLKNDFWPEMGEGGGCVYNFSLERCFSALNWGFATGWFPKGWFWLMFPCTEISSQKSCPAVPPWQKEATILIFLDPQNRNESPKPPFYKTTLVFPLDQFFRVFLNLWFAKPMVCMRVAFHENDGNHENDENDEDTQTATYKELSAALP